MYKGNPYASANNDVFTLIYTKMGAPFVGDAVLHLKETRCENLILFGSCGAVKQTPATNLGSIVIARKAYDFTNFSQLLAGNKKIFAAWDADKSLVDKLIKKGMAQDAALVNCATFGSFYLEEKYQKLLVQKDINVVDMECTAFFNAARHIKRKAAAFFYVTDILKKQHVFASLPLESQNKINASIAATQEIIMKFTHHLT
jgi:purine-nucleoside phosphorylase